MVEKAAFAVLRRSSAAGAAAAGMRGGRGTHVEARQIELQAGVVAQRAELIDELSDLEDELDILRQIAGREQHVERRDVENRQRLEHHVYKIGRQRVVCLDLV